MSLVEDVMIPLTVVVNSENTKVLFAEAGNDFTDILLSFLTLPLGKILLLFKKHYREEAPVIGSLNTLYNSLANLDDVYFWTNEGKQMLVNPRSNLSDDCHNLIFNIDDSPPTMYFVCETRNCSHTRSISHNSKYYSNRTISLYNCNARCQCGKLMNIEISTGKDSTTVHHDEGVFTMKSSCNFTISDDMEIKHNASGFIVQNLRDLGITDIYGTVNKTIDVGCDEVVDLLKGLLLSQTPLTDFVCQKTRMNNAIETCKPNIELQIEQKEETSKKMVVKVALQKSTNKFLFAQVTEDFADFLFSLLTIPLGGVTHLLSGNTHLGSVDNLYRSVVSFESEHFKTNDMKTKLLEPQLPLNYLSEYQILPISEKVTKLYFYVLHFPLREFMSSWAPDEDLACIVINPKGKSCFLKSHGIFMVTDNLTVTPLSTISTISHLNELGIPLSDVENMEMEIGVNEALAILKESLVSTSVFTNALIKPILKRQPKQDYMFRSVKLQSMS